jgi:hypothetical protein
MHMNKSQPRDRSTRAIVKLLCDHVFRLKQVRHIFRELFEDDDAQALTEKTADAFFHDLSNIVADYFLLAVAKITDPATSINGKRENFSIANLMETVEWPPDCLQEVERLNDGILSFRKCIGSVRNQFLTFCAYLPTRTW